MQATVRNGERVGRGFSIPELKEAGLDPRTARKHGVPTDVWRDTKYEQNVEQLKAVAKSVKARKEKKPEPAEKPKPRKAAPKKKTAKRKQTRRKK